MLLGSSHHHHHYHHHSLYIALEMPCHRRHHSLRRRRRCRHMLLLLYKMHKSFVVSRIEHRVDVVDSDDKWSNPFIHSFIHEYMAAIYELTIIYQPWWITTKSKAEHATYHACTLTHAHTIHGMEHKVGHLVLNETKLYAQLSGSNDNREQEQSTRSLYLPRPRPPPKLLPPRPPPRPPEPKLLPPRPPPRPPP